MTDTAAAHTPGPWIIGRGADGYPIVHTAPDTFSPSGQGVAHVCKRAMSQEHSANARLIAAAPDLLAALRDVMEYLGPEEVSAYPSVQAAVVNALIRNVRAAIAKAEGR